MTDVMEDMLSESIKCVKCGACLSVCPVYKELLKESDSPRGRAALSYGAAKEEIDPSKRLVEIFTKCLSCGACEDTCTKGVPVIKIIYEMREMLYEKRHHDRAIHSLIKLMYGAPYIFTLFLKNASFLKPILFAEEKDSGLLSPRIRLPFIDTDRLVPKVRKKFFLDNEFEDVSADKEHVTLFAGCIFNFIYPETAMSSLELIRRTGAKVHVVKEQSCCGFPALSVGDFSNLKSTVIKNIDILDKTGPEKIISLCSSCTLMFKKNYPLIFEGASKSERDKVKKFAEKVVDITEYLFGKRDKLNEIQKEKSRIRATYHVPCHLAYGLKNKDTIRDTLNAVDRIELIEPANPVSCCGYGGIFNFRYPGLSERISDRKAKDITDTKAEVVFTSCSGCIMQIKEALIRNGSYIKVMHISEI